MSPNGDCGASDHGDVLECLNESCRFKLRVGFYEKAEFVICPECRCEVVRPSHPAIRDRRLQREFDKRREAMLRRADKLEEEARALRLEAGGE